MDKVIAYNIVLAQIPGKAKAAAHFSSRMQTDLNKSLELQLVNSIPMKQREIDMKARTPDASMLATESAQEFEAKPTVPKDLIGKIQSNDALQHLISSLDKILKSASNYQKPELYAIKRAIEINSIQEKDPMVYFQVSNLNSKALDIGTEQKKDPILRKVMTWIDTGCNDDLTYASLELRKHFKHLTSMADPLSVQLLSFTFASATYSYTRLAQGLNKSATGFSSFVKSYLDSCFAANLCRQFMDDIGC